MKTIITILTLLIVNTVFAQYPVLQNLSLSNPNDEHKIGDRGTYAVDTNNFRDQYLGLWQYNQNGLFLQLKIEKIDKRISKSTTDDQASYYFEDVVIIKYKLIKNGVLLFDNLNETNLDNIYSSGIQTASQNYLDGRFLEYSRNINSYFTITRLGTSPETINFNLSRVMVNLKNPPSFYNDGQPTFNIPALGIILTKI
jgi:hypothetical protein